MIVAMTGVTFMDSTGLGALIAARKTGLDRDSSIRLVGVAGGPAKVLQLTGLAEVFST
jgi:anti-sigma B factor antagonist